MKKHATLWIILGIIAVIVVWAISANNKMITKQENVNDKWGNVQSDYQRRKDLVEQAINVVSIWPRPETQEDSHSRMNRLSE